MGKRLGISSLLLALAFPSYGDINNELLQRRNEPLTMSISDYSSDEVEEIIAYGFEIASKGASKLRFESGNKPYKDKLKSFSWRRFAVLDGEEYELEYQVKNKRPKPSLDNRIIEDVSVREKEKYEWELLRIDKRNFHLLFNLSGEENKIEHDVKLILYGLDREDEYKIYLSGEKGPVLDLLARIDEDRTAIDIYDKAKNLFESWGESDERKVKGRYIYENKEGRVFERSLEISIPDKFPGSRYLSFPGLVRSNPKGLTIYAFLLRQEAKEFLDNSLKISMGGVHLKDYILYIHEPSREIFFQTRNNLNKGYGPITQEHIDRIHHILDSAKPDSDAEDE